MIFDHLAQQFNDPLVAKRAYLLAKLLVSFNMRVPSIEQAMVKNYKNNEQAILRDT